MTVPFALVFPGQGSQAVGMLDAWDGNPAVAQVLAQASDALGEDAGALIHGGPKEQLDLTTHTQPSMLVAGVANFQAWRHAGGPLPVAMAGHSLGEYSALVAAGALSLADAVPLVRLRADAMQQAVPVGTGAMAAILGLDADAVREHCAQAAREAGGVVEAVNFNDPKQTVIAGDKAAVDAACALLKAAGAKRALPLPVSAPFHSSLMKPAAERLKERLASIEFRTPQVPVVSNIDARAYRDADDIRDGLYRQAFGPVRWVDVVLALKAAGARQIHECGPGKVLSGLVKRIDGDIGSGVIVDPASLEQVRAQVAGAQASGAAA